MKLLFDSNKHLYFFEEEPDIKLTSVSTLIGMYHEKFDSDKHSKRIAEREGVSQEEILERWKKTNQDSLTLGTAYHKKREEKYLEMNGVHSHKEVNGIKQALDITKLTPGIYPELIVYHPEYNIVGTADYIEILPDNSFICRDWKTNKKLDFEGFPVWNPKTFKKEPKKMFPPLSHLSDCNGIHYSLQLSAYSWILEEAGYICKSIILEHVLFDEDEQDIMVVDYPINYLKKEVRNLFEHFKSKQ